MFSPSPLAIGFPSDAGPVLVDVSTSITTNGLTSRLCKEGKRLPHHWLIDAFGEPSDDPADLYSPHRGTILPLGGLDAGHKGNAIMALRSWPWDHGPAIVREHCTGEFPPYVR